MIDYDKEKHEDLLIAWYYAQLRAEPEEFAKLFMKPLRSLTALLNWAAHTVHLMLSVDERGIWGAAWVDPFLSGAYFGTWMRKDRRGTIGAYALVRHAQRDALKVFPILIGVTKQPALHKVHLALGYELVGKLEKVFDGDDAWVYKLSQETINERRNRRFDERIERAENPLIAGDDGTDRHGRLASGSGTSMVRVTKSSRKSLRSLSSKRTDGVRADAQHDNGDESSHRSQKRKQSGQSPKQPKVRDTSGKRQKLPATSIRSPAL